MIDIDALEKLRATSKQNLPDGQGYEARRQGEEIIGAGFSFLKKVDDQFPAILAELRAGRELREAAEPMRVLITNTSGRIPAERLSFAQWHRLSKSLAKFDAMKG